MRRWIARIFPMLPFLSYLRPYRKQVALALACLVFVGFLEPFSILMLKPGLDLIFGLQKKPERSALAVQVDTVGQAVGQAARTAAGEVRTLAEHVAGSSTNTKPRGESGSAPADDTDTKVSPFKRIENRVKEWGRAQLAPITDWYVRLAAQRPFVALMFIAAILITATILKGIFDFSSNYLLTYSMRAMTVDLQIDILRRVLSQDFLFFKEKTTGYLISRIASDVQLIRDVTLSVIRDGLQQPLTLFFLFLALLYLSPAMTLVAVIMIPASGIILYQFARRLRKITRKTRKKGDELSSMLEETLRNYPVVKTFGTEEQEIKRFTAQSERIFELGMKGRAIRFGTGPLMESLGALSLGGVLLLGGYLILLKGTLGPTGFIVYLVALTRFYEPVKRLSRMNVRFQEAMVSAERLREMLAMQPRIATPPEAVEPAAFKEAIRLEQVTFAYREEAVLQEVTLEIPKGKMVALVGPTGAGKTTLMGLLPRLYDPQQGRVTLDGIDLRQVDLARLRKLFGIVTQETVLFNDTVLKNITYGSPHIDRKRAEECAEAANAHEFILSLENGYETVIGQSGMRLSGGQAQRIAIARALYRDPPILLFDEATSHLDSRTEALVQKAVDRLLEGRTAVVIAHRLSTVRKADIIVVMEMGRVVETGTHGELMAQMDLYKSLYALQSSP